jgi:hypothetical protein
MIQIYALRIQGTNFVLRVVEHGLDGEHWLTMQDGCRPWTTYYRDEAAVVITAPEYSSSRGSRHCPRLAYGVTPDQLEVVELVPTKLEE